MKTLKIITLFLIVTVTVNAQSPWSGFFKPVKVENSKLKAIFGQTSTFSIWLFRPTISLSAIKMQYVGGDKSFENSSLQTLGTGISYQQITTTDAVVYTNLAVNGLVLYNMDFSGTKPINLGIAATVGVFNNLISGGIGFDFGQKYPFILLNASLNLNK